jgi:hypothetical protein
MQHLPGDIFLIPFFLIVYNTGFSSSKMKVFCPFDQVNLPTNLVFTVRWFEDLSGNDPDLNCSTVFINALLFTVFRMSLYWPLVQAMHINITLAVRGYSTK